MTTSHTFSGAHTLDTRTHGAEKSQGAYQRTATVLVAATAVLVSSAPAASCCRCTPAYYYADIIRCCTTTPSPPSPSPTSAAVCWIVLGEELCPLLVIQSSQGARGEEFAAEFRSFPASRRLLWGVRSLALPRRSSRAFVRAAVRLYPAGFAQTAPVRSTSWKDPMPPSAYVKAIEELSSPRPAAFSFAVSQAHAGFGRSKL